LTARVARGARPKENISGNALRDEEKNGFVPLRRSLRLADQVYEQIVGQIVAGTMPMGEKLPSESRLCELFGVSRPVIRESISRLQADGLAVTRHGAGTYIAKRPRNEFLNLAPIGCVADLMRCYEFRIALEGEAAFLAAQRRTRASLAGIDASLIALNRAIRTKTVGAEADRYFHVMIASASQNEMFQKSLDVLSEHIFACMYMARSLSLTHSPERLAVVQSEHEMIAAAIRAGDAEAARANMRRHIDNARARVLGEVSIDQDLPQLVTTAPRRSRLKPNKKR